MIKTIKIGCVFILLSMLMMVSPSKLLAQKKSIPYTPTLPGIENPLFPYAQPNEIEIPIHNFNMLSKEIRSWVEDEIIAGGELLIIKDEKIIFHEAFGWADREESRPMDRNAIYNGGSMAKPYTNAAILKLIDQGKLSFDDPVSNYIENFPYDDILISHLLTHTSGYGYADEKDIIWPIPDSIKTRKQFINLLITLPRPFSLGEFNYTNFSQYFLARIIEKATDISTEEYLQHELLDPIDANETFLYLSSENNWKHRIPSMYAKDSTGHLKKIWDHGMKGGTPFFCGAADIFLTPMDFARLLKLWKDSGSVGDKQLLSESIIKKSIKKQTGKPQNKNGYGYNWYVWEENEKPVYFGHGGIWGTLGNYWVESDTYVLFFTQTYLQDRKVVRQALANRLRLWNFLENLPLDGIKEISSSPSVIEMSHKQLKKYEGTYTGVNPSGDTLTYQVVADKNRLILQDKFDDFLGIDWVFLAPTGNDSFMLGYYQNDQMKYSKNEKARIVFLLANESYAYELKIGNKVVFRANRKDE